VTYTESCKSTSLARRRWVESENVIRTMLAGSVLYAWLALAGGIALAQESDAPATGKTGDDASTSDGETVAGATDTASQECSAEDDFPTTAVADYVLGCMAANGNSYQALQQCSCSIDFIKARMSYKEYEQAGTVLQVQQDIGQRGIFYRDSHWAKDRIEKLENLQAESTLRCFQN